MCCALLIGIALHWEYYKKKEIREILLEGNDVQTSGLISSHQQVWCEVPCLWRDRADVESQPRLQGGQGGPGGLRLQRQSGDQQ